MFPGTCQLQLAPPLLLVRMAPASAVRAPLWILPAHRSFGNPPRLTLIATESSALVTFDQRRTPAPPARAELGASRQSASAATAPAKRAAYGLTPAPQQPGTAGSTNGVPIK